MGSFARFRIVLGLVLILCLALVVRWALRSEDSLNAPKSVDSGISLDTPKFVAGGDSTDDRRATKQTPANTQTGADADRPTPEPSSAFGTLRGRVIDAVTRQPVRAFEIAFHPHHPTNAGVEAPGQRTFQTADGRFEWPHLPPGNWIVSASSRGYERFIANDIQISRGVATDEVTLPVRAGYPVRGRVFEEDSGVGIANAHVTYRETDADRVQRNRYLFAPARSEQGGWFVLEGVPAGRVTVDVSAGNFARRSVEVAVSSEMAPVEIAVSAGGSITGHLTAPDGVTPVKGIASLLQVEGSSMHGMGHGTGERGEFSFQQLSPGRYLLSGKSMAGSVSREIVLARNQRIEAVVLMLKEGHSIRGSVKGLRPEELARISVSMSHEGDVSSHESVQADERGAYAMHGVLPGRVQIDVEAGSRQLTRTVEMPAGADITVDLEFPAGARLSGRVTRAGTPLAGAHLSAQPVVDGGMSFESATTSQTGTYAINDLPDGEYRLWVNDYRSRSMLVAGDTVFDLDVPSAQLAGRVVEEGGKAPIVGAVLDIWSAQASSERIRLHARSDQAGQFAFVGLEPGDFTLTIYKEGYDMYRQRVSYASPVTDMAVSLRPSKGVQIRVRAAAKIGDRSGSRLTIALDENGMGQIPGSLAGSALAFHSGGFAPVIVPAWGGEPLELEFRPQETPQ